MFVLYLPLDSNLEYRNYIVNTCDSIKDKMRNITNSESSHIKIFSEMKQYLSYICISLTMT